MVGQGSGHSRRALNPLVTMAADRETEAEAVMKIAEIVATTNDVHAGHERLGLLGQGAGAPGQPGKAGAKGGVEPLDVSGVDDTDYLLRDLQQARYLLGTTLDNTPLNGQTRRCALFDHLHNGDVGPGDQL